MSKRSELQKEYFNEHAKMLNESTFTLHYALWLEDKILNLTNSTAKDCKMCRVLITKTNKL